MAILEVINKDTGKTLILRAVDQGDGTAILESTATILSDVQIGAVEIKNDISNDRAKVGTDNHLNTVRRNLDDFKIRVLDTGTVNAEKVGPAQAVADGMSVLVVADPANSDAVKVGGVGETGTADQFFELQPGDALPTKLSVSNFNKIAAQSPTADQKLFLIAEV